MTLDVAAIRARFPALGREHDGRPYVFLDGPGGTQVVDGVIEAVVDYYRTANANSGGAFPTSERSDALVAEARAAVADFLGAPSPETVKFGANMTTLTFHVSRSIAASLRPGDEIVVTVLDHEANVSPWRLAAADRGLVVRTVDVHPEDGTLDLESLDAALGSRTRVVAVGYASNAIGTVNPVAEIVRRAHAVGALAYVDAVHWAPHGPIDVVDLDVDFLVCSAYKFFGPHLGVLYGKLEHLDRLPAYKVRPAHDRWETGTGNFEGIVGTGAAVEYLAWLGRTFGDPVPGDGAGGGEAPVARRRAIVAGMNAVRAYELGLFGRLLDGLRAIAGVRLFGIADPARLAERAPTAALTIAGTHPRAAAEALGRQGIATWDGDFYARALIERLGLAEAGGVLRAGLVHYNTAAEVDRFLEAIERLARAAA
ncbi:MAG TPA: cysteine desulfurase-like protein [Candidatus Binatia bacterium]|nr:cysteine desulfurase-like protein [Candidatus Binatia bacterium]